MNHYESLPSKRVPQYGASPVVRIIACIIGLTLFATNPFRDLWFYEDIAAHEGFGTTSDTYIIGFASQLMATLVFFPVAIFLIGYGIGRSKRITFLPRIDQFTWGWGILSSLIAGLMLLMEFDQVRYCVRYVHHFDTLLLSVAYMGFIYFWRCCSLSHASPKQASRWKSSSV